MHRSTNECSNIIPSGRHRFHTIVIHITLRVHNKYNIITQCSITLLLYLMFYKCNMFLYSYVHYQVHMQDTQLFLSIHWKDRSHMLLLFLWQRTLQSAFHHDPSGMRLCCHDCCRNVFMLLICRVLSPVPCMVFGVCWYLLFSYLYFVKDYNLFHTEHHFTYCE